MTLDSAIKTMVATLISKMGAFIGLHNASESSHPDIRNTVNAKANINHTHGNIKSDGTVGSAAQKPLITTTNGLVIAGSFESNSINIKMNGATANVGSLNTFARADHVHPVDTSRASTAVATTNSNGLLSYQDKRILDGIATTLAEQGVINDEVQRALNDHNHGNITGSGQIGTTAYKPIITSSNGVLVAGSFGSTAHTFCEGNDPRLSDSRAPTAHTHTKSQITDFSHTHGNITNDGKVTAAVSSINKIAVTDSSNAIKVVDTIPFSKLAITKSDITGLGIPAQDTNTTYTAESTATNIKMNGTQSAGSSSKYARADHVHPSDTTKANVSSLSAVATSGSYNDLSNKPTISTAGKTGKYSDLLNVPSTFTPSSHAHGSLTNAGTLNSNADSVNKIAVTDSSNNLKTISKLPLDKVTHQDISGKIDTAGTGLSKSGTKLNHSNSVGANSNNKIKKFTHDAQGHITGSTDIVKADITGLGIADATHTHTKSQISDLSDATDSQSGLLTAENKRKLDSITSGAKARKRVPGLHISSPIDETNQTYITINRNTRLKVILYDQEDLAEVASLSDATANQILNTTVNYNINGVNSNINSGGTMNIGLVSGEYTMHFLFSGSGNYYQIYRTITLKVV